MLPIISRLWWVVTLAWMAFCLYGFHDSGELYHMSAENWLMLISPVLIRWIAVFVVRGLPRPANGRLFRR